MSEGPIAESYGWSGSDQTRQREASFTPDMAALIDGSDEDEQETDFSAAAHVMEEIFRFVFSYRGDKPQPNLQVAFRRFVSVAWLLRPELLAGASLAELSIELSCTRALLSKLVRDFGDRWGGLRNRAMKTETAREVYRNAQLRDHWRYRDEKRPPVPCETGGCHAEHTQNPNAGSSA
jgi:hypothetical protein